MRHSKLTPETRTQAYGQGLTRYCSPRIRLPATGENWIWPIYFVMASDPWLRRSASCMAPNTISVVTTKLGRRTEWIRGAVDFCASCLSRSVQV